MKTYHVMVFMLMSFCVIPDSSCLHAESRTILDDKILQNGSFDEKGEKGIPSMWHDGWPNDPAGTQPGSFTLVSNKGSKKDLVLLVQPSADAGIFVTQVLDMPITELNGTTIDFKAEIMTEGDAAAVIMVVAVNPEAPVDPKTGLRSTGSAMITASNPKQFKEYSASLKITGPAEFVMIAAGGMGNKAKIYINNISLVAGYNKKRAENKSVLTANLKKTKSVKPRGFRVGFVNESPQNQSIRATDRMLSKVTSVGELVNIFFHFKNNASQKKPLLTGHEKQLSVSGRAQKMKLDRMLTLDFTHAGPESVGTLSPMSDGTKISKINDDYKTAYIGELLALCKEVRPSIVSIGIEMSIFYDKNPDMWPSFVSMYKDAYKRVKKLYPQTHVTTYFTHEWMVDKERHINEKHADVWKMLLPELDSIAFSSYPSGDQVIPMDYPEGYFSAVRAVAPDKPIAIPEFGIRSSDSPMFNEEYQTKLLGQILKELGETNTEFVVAFSLYDQQYLGTSDWYKKVFRSIGFFNIDGEPKKSWKLWEALPPYKKSGSIKKK